MAKHALKSSPLGKMGIGERLGASMDNATSIDEQNGLYSEARQFVVENEKAGTCQVMAPCEVMHPLQVRRKHKGGWNNNGKC